MYVFPNTDKVKHALRQMVQTHGEEILNNRDQLVLAMGDTLPEYEKECRLFGIVLGKDLLAVMRNERNHDVAVRIARQKMNDELFLSDAAVEFVITCFTFMMGWDDVSAAKAAPAQADAPVITSPLPQGTADKPRRIFDPHLAARYRWKRSVRIDDGITMIDAFCFDGFGLLRSIAFPDSLVSIGEFAFSECRHLEKIDLPPDLRRIDRGAFQSCSRLAEIRIPDGVTAIEPYTFAFCERLCAVELPDSITSIGESAFEKCVSLKTILLSENVREIGDNAFKSCPDLTIACYENTYAHKFCTAHDLRCKVLRKG